MTDDEKLPGKEAMTEWDVWISEHIMHSENKAETVDKLRVLFLSGFVAGMECADEASRKRSDLKKYSAMISREWERAVATLKNLQRIDSVATSMFGSTKRFDA